MINLRTLVAYLRSKKGVEFTMSTLAIIIIVIIGLILLTLFITGKWADLTAIFGGIEKSAIEQVP